MSWSESDDAPLQTMAEHHRGVGQGTGAEMLWGAAEVATVAGKGLGSSLSPPRAGLWVKGEVFAMLRTSLLRLSRMQTANSNIIILIIN